MTKRFRDILVLLATGGLAMGLLAACTGVVVDEGASAAGGDALEARVQALEAASGPGPAIMVQPAFFNYPASRTPDPGLWFYGSGLEPNQWFRISIEAEGEDGDVTFGVDDLRQANETGAFALTQPELRPDRWAVRDVFGQSGGVFNVKLWDMDTDTLLAWTPLVVCGSNAENPWCLPEEEVVAEPGAATVFNVARIRIEDGFFQLRVGPTPLFGYEADSRIDSSEGDGWVMTIALGDSINITDRLENRGSVDHNFTIADLGIDVPMTPDLRIEGGFLIKPDRVGEFVINDSTDPDGHGKALLIVTEASGGAGGGGGGGTVFSVADFVVEDGRFQLRMGPQPYWGYEADARPFADEVGGLVMTVKVGDTIMFETLRQSGSRSTVPHFFTIEAMGINIALADGNVEPFELTFDTAGEFIIDDSSDPGSHGDVKIVVE